MLMADWYEMMSGWSEEGLRQLMVLDEARHGAGVWTLDDAASRLVSLAGEASSQSDIYDAIMDDRDMQTQMEIAIRLGNPSAVIPDAALRIAASSAIDLAARVLVERQSDG